MTTFTYEPYENSNWVVKRDGVPFAFYASEKAAKKRCDRENTVAAAK